MDADPAAGTTQTDGEAALRDWEGLPPEAMIPRHEHRPRLFRQASPR
jgi:hypothetical protein